MASDDDRPWLVPIPPGFRRCGLSHTARDVLVALCGCARTKCYAWVSNAAIAETLGLHEDTVRAALRELDVEGWIARPMEDGWRVRRIGVILRRRPDGMLHPVADDWYGIATATDALRRERAAWEASRRPRRDRGAAGAFHPAK